MQVVVLSAEDVARLLPMPACIAVMRDALAALAWGKALVPLGAGTQARTHLEAIASIRSLRTVRIWSRNLEHARALVAEQKGRYNFGIEAVATAEAAVRGADIVTTVTASPEPVLQRAW